MWWWRDELQLTDGGRLQFGFTDRLSGLGAEPIGSLNLGGKVGDDPAVVAGNRALVAGQLGLAADRLSFMNQVHGARLVDAGRAQERSADAQFTDQPGQGLAVLVADCTPVLLFDESGSGLIAAVHAGRPGMTAGVVPGTVDALRERGAGALRAVVGPSVCGRCYEVPAPMRDEAAAVAAVSAAVSWSGTPAIDVAAGVVSQLHEREVPLTWVRGCTRESESLFSYRRNHGDGRFAGVIARSE